MQRTSPEHRESPTMLPDQMVYVAAVTVLGVLEQAYFSWQVIYARRKYSVQPPATSGPPEFERVFRAQVNCAEYFPIFLALLWVTGLYFSEGVSAVCGLIYLYSRYKYFCGYSLSSQGRLAPLYFSARVLWSMIAFSALGILRHTSRLFFGLDILYHVMGFLGL
ncbi:leukotriene C4 synthase [Polypterus senegalus]|uniref:leukotriene C4 synthase n=1 Tax=Polypterus senegalus TaxID=55291 RepID=UPI00196694DD|nr:leukotriene C4 synthase [Polypterus senegalus]